MKTFFLVKSIPVFKDSSVDSVNFNPDTRKASFVIGPAASPIVIKLIRNDKNEIWDFNGPYQHEFNKAIEFQKSREIWDAEKCRIKIPRKLSPPIHRGCRLTKFPERGIYLY